MKKIILPVLIALFLGACEEKIEVKRIQWTSSSPEAKKAFLKNFYQILKQGIGTLNCKKN